MTRLAIALVLVCTVAGLFFLAKSSKDNCGANSSCCASQKHVAVESDAMVPAVNDTTFAKEVLKSDKLVLVDCWAPWCGQCKVMAPVVHELAKKLDGKLKVVKLNVDESPMSADRHGVRRLPGFLVFKNGKVVDQTSGLVPIESLYGMVSKHL